MPVCLLSRLQDALGEVHAMRIFLQSKQDLSSCRRAVDEGRLEGLQPHEMIGVDMAEEASDPDAWEFWLSISLSSSEKDRRLTLYDSLESRHVID